MRTRVLHIFMDPSHGWCRVKGNDKTFLRVCDKVSEYSYCRNGYVFLEEDGDLGVYIEQLKKDNIPFRFIEHSGNRSSRIRNYERYDSKNPMVIREATERWGRMI